MGFCTNNTWTFVGGNWLPMKGETPNCSQIPVMKDQTIHIFGSMSINSDILIFITFLIAEILQFNFLSYQYHIHTNYYTFQSSNIIPLRKYPSIQTVSLMIHMDGHRGTGGTSMKFSKWVDEL